MQAEARWLSWTTCWLTNRRLGSHDSVSALVLFDARLHGLTLHCIAVALAPHRSTFLNQGPRAAHWNLMLSQSPRERKPANSTTTTTTTA